MFQNLVHYTGGVYSGGIPCDLPLGGFDSRPCKEMLCLALLKENVLKKKMEKLLSPRGETWKYQKFIKKEEKPCSGIIVKAD